MRPDPPDPSTHLNANSLPVTKRCAASAFMFCAKAGPIARELPTKAANRAIIPIPSPNTRPQRRNQSLITRFRRKRAYLPTEDLDKNLIPASEKNHRATIHSRRRAQRRNRLWRKVGKRVKLYSRGAFPWCNLPRAFGAISLGGRERIEADVRSRLAAQLSLNFRHRTDFSEGSGGHCGQSPGQEIGRARGSSIWRWFRARFLLLRRSLRLGGGEPFAVVALRLGGSLGGGSSFALPRGCAG